jgi:hypothetical protein
MTQIQAGEGVRFPHRRNPRGSLRERRSGMDNGVCQENRKNIYSGVCNDSSRENHETPLHPSATAVSQQIQRLR